MIKNLDIKKIDISTFLETDDSVEKITKNTANTWQPSRSFQTKQKIQNLESLQKLSLKTTVKIFKKYYIHIL